MADITEFKASDGTVLRVEVDGPPAPYDGGAYEPVRRRREGGTAAVADSLRQAVDRVRPAAQDVLNSLRAMPEAPDRVALEFGVKLSADAGVVLARASSEAHFKVLLEWERRPGGADLADADDRPSPDTDDRPSPDANDRPSPDANDRPSPDTDDRPSPDAEPSGDDG
ncbi:CU044_2847 family protein [Streptomyces sp. NL15-2K]|nr:CU044_2847 family protein [Streptomyces sp. NL15-2K]GCB46581.1 hypothetical protein SNL152K_3879 [Streptomyces sp. NL15-2K]